MRFYRNLALAAAILPAMIISLPFGGSKYTTDNSQTREIRSYNDKMPSEMLYRKFVVENPTNMHTPPTPTSMPSPTASPTPVALSGKDLFLQGYRTANGPEEYAEHFVDYVIPLCENKGRPDDGWYWDYNYGDYHLSAAQFSKSSWNRVSLGRFDPNNPYEEMHPAATGLTDPANLYDVGFNVATWIKPEKEGGFGTYPAEQWPNCWQ